ncbi:hypothetical protein ACEQ8H_002805 [Pleosporales sp. CAS-2024a]
MATPTTPIYHDPTLAQTRSRRSSSRRSLGLSLSRSTSQRDSPRSPCPKDGDAFSYDPAHLRYWYLPHEIWLRLSASMQSSLAAVQHSGAAVLTGFARLDKMRQDQEDLQLERLPSPKFRTSSNASSVLYSDSSSATATSSFSQSGSASPITSPLAQPQPRPAFSPVSLGPAAESLAKRSRSRDRSFSTPLEPHDAYHAAELSHLRTEALPRLRHLSRKVDVEWVDAKRSASLSADDVNAFENWWAEKSCSIVSLNEKGKSLAEALGIVPTGMGWCAP